MLCCHYFYRWRQYLIWGRLEPPEFLMAFGSIKPWLRNSGPHRNVIAKFYRSW